MTTRTNPFQMTAQEIEPLLDPTAPFMPELETARANLASLRNAPQTLKTLAWTEQKMEDLANIPQTTYTDYRLFMNTGDRQMYETPYFARRTMLAGMALRLFFGQQAMKEPLQNMIWAICEETNWVLPAHERVPIDLFSAETAFMLAETVTLLGEQLDAEVRSRVRFEIERRVFQPFLTWHGAMWWYHGYNNWNGVCNSSVAAAFLLLEPEPGRVARALELVFKGLETFFKLAFETDGASTEGVSYWNYGLINYVALAEMLRSRTHGAIDLLDGEHMRLIAAYPAKMLLSPARFAAFSDCDELLNFNPGMISRLRDRTSVQSLNALLSPPIPSERQWRLTMMLRDILWWDGEYHRDFPAEDAYLPVGGTARLVSQSKDGTTVVMAIKAGHNDENHNQNDVGSFLLHVGEETFLVDPGRGLYTRQYFGPERYQNPFANSYGHSVPRIGGQLEKEGRQHCGEMTWVELNQPVKCAEVEFGRAYEVENLASLHRRISLTEEGKATLQDTIRFSADPLEVEEAFITWLDVEVSGSTAVLLGEKHNLGLTVASPAGAAFQLERLEEASAVNHKPGVLKRLTVIVPPALESQVVVQAEVLAK